MKEIQRKRDRVLEVADPQVLQYVRTTLNLFLHALSRVDKSATELLEMMLCKPGGSEVNLVFVNIGFTFSLYCYMCKK